ncbi:hypothetical protein CRI77_17530 [Mycolicibacterium duvalii]|uniref:Uncharacterized protein n=1 Tax=Mycolicibacterium duvalii TaxID=39688 RepID=A0A7I7K6B5_9MYCO|nr:hypothetical protein [Mycolicibacterium duvalii]MCV7366184.1 hypothetical protein [Mycolicibacterium duvalii]PEG38836.1 hypothetical protein CRI77_17530 [Mycolicibacterium duvalii]BBX19635.1 hypothetical protein MDUV_44950 [Mycolicibacterium duvalii]
MAGTDVERALDELYATRPQDFTAVRTRLAAAAKRGGDPAGSRRIAGSRKPTTAAWVVNALAVQTGAREQLADLGARLRDAHAAMDGGEIRALTAEQRRVVDDLTRAAFRLTGLDTPTAAVRDDVVATLQAAVADPDVTARLGRLTKAEKWSGFGEFGSAAAVSSVKKNSPPPPARRTEEPKAEHRRAQRARAALLAAQRAKAEADDALTELRADLATARLRHQDAQRRLREAEDALTAAQDAYDAATQAGREAAAAVREAQADYRRANG